MREARSIMADLAGSGLTPEQLALVMELSASLATEARPMVDQSAQRRRAKDRAYQATRRQHRQKSADSPDAAPCEVSSTPASSEPEGSSEAKPTRKKSVEVPGWMPAEEWADYSTMRKGMRAPFGAAAQKGIIEDLDRARRDGHCPAKMLKKAVKLGWRGVFGGDDTKVHGNGSASSRRPMSAAEIRNAIRFAEDHNDPDRVAELKRELEKQRPPPGPVADLVGRIGTRVGGSHG